ncbi:MAG: hypothetical protein H0X61_05650 [Acidimicrobiia bacterium]|nr:hypothetical protein [Acidimicrobiia bacterium]
MPNARRAAAALVLTCLVVGCSPDDKDPSATGTATTPATAAVTTSGSTTQDTRAATDPVSTASSGPDTVAPAGSSAPDTVTPTQPPTVPTQVPPTEPTAEPATEPRTETTTRPTVGTAPGNTTPPTPRPTTATPPATETGTAPATEDPRTAAGARLAARLPSAEQLGVPGDWTARDLQSGVDESSIPRSELDAFRGVVTCPDYVVALDDGGPWAERKVNGLDPDPDGVLIIRLQLIEESGADWSQRQQALAECMPASADAFFENGAGSVALPGSAGEVELQRIAVFSSATAAAPFPTQVVSMSANARGRTANVTMFGLNEADAFDQAVRTLLVDVLTAR